MVSTEPALAVADLRKSYGGRPVVDGVSFEALHGQVTAVLGPNGAGKTTTVECCEGLRRPDGGTVRVLGVEPRRAGPHLRARVGVMLQDGGLPTGARAGEVLRHVAAMYSDPMPPADLEDRLGLRQHTRTTVRRLSGGLRQRLALAVAVVGRPDVVFLDEPSAGLDPQSRLAVWDVVDGLRAAGAAVVLTTHLMDEAERLADRVVVVDHGRVVTRGTPGDLVGSRGETLRFGGPAGLDLSALAAALPGGVTVLEDGPGRYLVSGGPQAPLGPQAIATVTAWCAGLGVHPAGLTLRRPTLEDVFLELTGRELR